jgi:hypothetical protein
MEIVKGKITKFNKNGTVVICSSVPDVEKAILRKYKDVEIGFCDGRHISAQQRKAIYALIAEIADFVGDDIESQKETMKMDFVINHLQCMQKKIFSLSNCDMTTARMFQTYLIDFIIKHDIPTKISLLEHCSDITKYVYACTLNRKCAICGQAADLHHIDRIGQGNDRNEVHHLGRECLPLCREHHTICHNDEKAFISKYHLEPIKIDEKICRVYRLKK